MLWWKHLGWSELLMEGREVLILAECLLHLCLRQAIEISRYSHAGIFDLLRELAPTSAPLHKGQLRHLIG